MLRYSLIASVRFSRLYSASYAASNRTLLTKSSVISDTDQSIRSTAGKLLIYIFPSECKVPLEWAINNELSIIVLKNLLSILETSKQIYFKSLSIQLLERISKVWKIAHEEVIFFLDLFSLR